VIFGVQAGRLGSKKRGRQRSITKTKHFLPQVPILFVGFWS
jgi:hypothetical protein